MLDNPTTCRICLAALRTGLLNHCLHAAYLEYNWNGATMDAVFEVNQLG